MYVARCSIRHSACTIQHLVLGRYYRQTSQLPQASMPEPYTKYEPRLHVVLHQPEIPYNTGSVGRTCVAVGAKLWLVRPLGFRVDDYYLRRASTTGNTSNGRSSIIGTTCNRRCLVAAVGSSPKRRSGRIWTPDSSRRTCSCSAVSRRGCPIRCSRLIRLTRNFGSRRGPRSGA